VFGRSILFIVLIPLIELALLTQLIEHTSIFVTVLIVLVTGVVGISLTRRQGMKAWKNAHQQMAHGKSPSKEILDGVMILFAGAFLITPGLLTDCVGFSLLVPKIRNQLATFLVRWFKARTVATFQVNSWTMGPEFQPDDSDAEGPSVRVVDPDSDSSSDEDIKHVRFEDRG